MHSSKPSLLLIQGNCINNIPSNFTFSSFLEILREKNYEVVPVYGKSNVVTCINDHIIHRGDTLLIFDELGKLKFYTGRIYVGRDSEVQFAEWQSDNLIK